MVFGGVKPIANFDNALPASDTLLRNPFVCDKKSGTEPLLREKLVPPFGDVRFA